MSASENVRVLGGIEAMDWERKPEEKTWGHPYCRKVLHALFHLSRYIVLPTKRHEACTSRVMNHEQCLSRMRLPV